MVDAGFDGVVESRTENHDGRSDEDKGTGDREGGGGEGSCQQGAESWPSRQAGRQILSDEAAELLDCEVCANGLRLDTITCSARMAFKE